MPDPVEFFPLSGGTTVTVGGVEVGGTEEIERVGGQHLPDHTTEVGYEYTTRVGANAVTARISGWVNDAEFGALAALENRRQPFPVNAPNLSLPSCGLEKFTDTMQGGSPGAHHVRIDVKEVQRATTGRTTIHAVGPQTGTKTAEAGGAEGGGGTGTGPVLVQTTSQRNKNRQQTTVSAPGPLTIRQ